MSGSARALLAVVLTCAAACSTPSAEPQIATAAPVVPLSKRAIVPVASASAKPSERDSVTDDAPDPEAQRLFEARVAQAAIPLTPVPTPPRVTQIALEGTRLGEAPGMDAIGELTSAMLTEGQRATMPVHLAPGACMTFIAQGGLGAIELDLFLTAGEGSSARVLAEDPSRGPIAVIGGKGRCFTNDRGPLDAVLHATMRRGGGVVLVRAYSRTSAAAAK